MGALSKRDSLILQHQQLNTPYYTDSEKSSSELVQLLKPKTENLNYHTDQRDILSVEKSASALQNHSTNSVYSNNPATVSGIPPPLATDFAQASASSRYVCFNIYHLHSTEIRDLYLMK